MPYVYLIINKINNKKYIGSSRKPIIDLNYYGSGKAIKYALQKYGKENFIREILWEGKENARDIEYEYLHKYDAANNPMFYNMTNDSRGNNLHKNKTKKTLSEKLTGRTFSKETCNKISKGKLGKSNSKKGKTDGPKPGVSVAHKGRTSPNKGKGKHVELHKTTGEYIKTYSNYWDLAIDLQINPETVRCQLVGKAKTICNKQYIAKYIDN
jgi:hypothetical protein